MEKTIAVENTSMDLGCMIEKPLEQESIIQNEQDQQISNATNNEEVISEVQDQNINQIVSIDETTENSSETDLCINEQQTEVPLTKDSEEYLDDSINLNLTEGNESSVQPSDSIVETSDVIEANTRPEEVIPIAESSDVIKEVANDADELSDGNEPLRIVEEPSSDTAEESTNVIEEEASDAVSEVTVNDETNVINEEPSKVAANEEPSDIVAEVRTKVTEEEHTVETTESALNVAAEQPSSFMEETSSFVEESGDAVSKESSGVAAEETLQNGLSAEQPEVNFTEVSAEETKDGADETGAPEAEGDAAAMEVEEQVIHQEVPEQQMEVTEMTVVQDDGEYIISDHDEAIAHTGGYTVIEVQNDSDIGGGGGEVTLNDSDESLVLEHGGQQVIMETPEGERHKVILISGDITNKAYQAQVAEGDGSDMTQVLIVEGDNIIFEPVYYGENETEIVINEDTELVVKDAQDQQSAAVDDVETRIMHMEAEASEAEDGASATKSEYQPVLKELKSTKMQNEPSPKPKTLKLTKPSIDPAADVNIPCHIFGRNIDNPLDDIFINGRALPKPRLGVKVPYRNLTSQIVSKQEIAAEILERSQRRNLTADAPDGGDIFFAKSLTQRLANKLAPFKKLTPGEKSSDKATTSADARAASSSSAAEPTAVDSAAKENADLIALLEGDGAEELDEALEKKAAASIVVVAPMESKRTAAKKAIFAGTKQLSDQNLKMAKLKEQKKIEEVAEAKKREKEREIALKQLRELPALPKVRRGTGLALRRKRLEEEKRQQMLKFVKVEAPPVSEAPEPVLKVSNITKTYSRKRRSDDEEMLEALEAEEAADAVDENNVPADETIETPPAKVTKVSRRGAAAAGRVQVAPVTSTPLLSKSSRIIKKKVIWDPDGPPQSAVQQEVKRAVTSIKPDPEPETPPKQARVLPKRGNLSQKPVGLNTAANLKKKASAKVVKQYLQPKKKMQMRRNAAEEAESSEAAAPAKADAVAETSGAAAKSSPPSAGKERKQYKTEIEKLLMDEGAVNMIYSVKQEETESGVQKKRKSVSLTNKTLEVKNNLSAVADAGATPGKGLRKAKAVTPAALRKKSQDSNRSSVHSPPPSPGIQFRATAECSRIIRRHSSSSSFSSGDEAEGRTRDRKENKNDTIVIQRSVPTQNGDKLESPSSVGRPVRKKGVPIYVSTGNRKTYKGKRKLDGGLDSSSTEDVFTNNNATTVTMTPSPASAVSEPKPAIKVMKLEQRTKPKLLTNADKSKLSTEMAKNFKRVSMRNKSQGNADGGEPIVIDADNGAMEDMPNSLQYTNYKEISLKKLEQLVQIILTPVHNTGSSPSKENTFNVQMFKEMSDVLGKLKTDDEVRAVLLTSAGSTFCHGVDWTSLVVPDKVGRREIATATAKAMKEFLLALAHFPKPLIAGIHGATENLGVTMLPLFDMVLASDKATFRTPYAKVGSAAEAGVLLTLGHLQPNALVSELLLTCKKLTASEALRYGLVTRILWPDKFHEELIPIAKGIASQSAQSMQATKSLLRLPLWEKLEEALHKEQAILIKHWTSEEFQKNIQFYIEDDD